ncbi:MAG: hypothetical protein WC274_03405 [Sulfurimonas sp.]|jgi:hypothetical protein
MNEEEVLKDTVEYLDEKLREAIIAVNNIAAKVYEGNLDAYEGFTQTEKYNKIIVEIGNKLKEKGIDITQIPEYQQL